MNRTNTTKGRPFKKLYCDRPETFLLPSTAFKIWMYYYRCEGPDRKSWPATETIMKSCDVSRRHFFKWKSFLVENGWLSKVGEIPSRTEGGRPVPIVRVKRGTIPVLVAEKDTNQDAKKDTHPRQKGVPTPAKRDTNLRQKGVLEVEPSELEPSEVNTSEVNGPVNGSGLVQGKNVTVRSVPDEF